MKKTNYVDTPAPLGIVENLTDSAWMGGDRTDKDSTVKALLQRAEKRGAFVTPINYPSAKYHYFMVTEREGLFSTIFRAPRAPTVIDY